jgi:hypothetical protein
MTQKTTVLLVGWNPLRSEFETLLQQRPLRFGGRREKVGT